MLQNITIKEQNGAETIGNLFIKYTDIASCLVLKNDESDNDLNFESSPFLPPIRKISGFDDILVVDLLFFTQFYISDNEKSPSIVMQDSSYENKVTIIFPKNKILKEFIDMLKSKHTIKIGINSNFIITRYYPKFSGLNPETQIIHDPALIKSPEIILNRINLYRKLIGPIPKERPYTSFNNCNLIAVKEKLLTYKVPKEQQFYVFLKLLKLPDIENFDNLKTDYFLIKHQWSSQTVTQLKRSFILGNIISNIFFTVKSDREISDKNKSLVFNILMSLVQTNHQLNKYINYIIRILKPILLTLENKPNELNPELNNLETNEAILFWVMFKFLFRCEIISIFELDSNEILEDIHMFIHHLMPFASLLFSKILPITNSDNMHLVRDKYLSRIHASAFSLFLDLFSNEDNCIDMWLTSLASQNVKEFFDSFIIAILLYNDDICQLDKTNVKYNDFLEFLNDSLKKLGEEFVISAGAAICQNLQKLLNYKI